MTTIKLKGDRLINSTPRYIYLNLKQSFLSRDSVEAKHRLGRKLKLTVYRSIEEKIK